MTRNTVPLHSHDCYEWHYVLAGDCSFRIGDDVFPIKRGDLFVIKPRQEHGVLMQSDQDWLLQYVVHCRAESREDKALMREWHQEFPHTANMGNFRQRLFARLDNVTGLDQNPDDKRQAWALRSAEHSFRAMLYSLLARQIDTQGIGEYEGEDAVQKILTHMHGRLESMLRLDELADLVNLDKSYLSRLFKKQIGVAPLQHFTNLKMAYAAQILRSSSASVQEIAEDLGYEAGAHFSRLFKRWSGLSPGAFRKQG